MIESKDSGNYGQEYMQVLHMRLSATRDCVQSGFCSQDCATWKYSKTLFQRVREIAKGTR